MGLFDRKAKAPAATGATFGRTWSEAPRSEATALPDLYHRSPRLDPVDLIAQTIADAPIEVFKTAQLRAQGDDAIPIPNSPILDLFDRPCPAFPELDGYALKYITVVLTELLGECFWVKVREGKRVTELLPFPPAWCMTTPTIGNPVFQFSAFGSTSGRVFTLPPSDVIWFKQPNIVDPFGRGRGRTEAMGDELDADEMAARWQKNYFYNDSVPPILVSVKGATSNDLERLKDSWNRTLGGWVNARKPAFFGDDTTVTKLSDTVREMEFTESRKYLRDSFNQHYSIPPELFGIIENSNRSTIDSAFYLFSKNVISRRLGFYERVITNQLVNPDFDAGLCVKFQFEVPADEAFKLQVANDGFSRGAITRAEWRKAMGYDVKENDDVFIVPFSVMEVPRDGAIEAPEPSEAEEPEEPESSGVEIEEPEAEDEAPEAEDEAPAKSVSKGLDAMRAALYKAFDAKAREGEGMFRSRLRAFAAEQRKRVAKAISANPEKPNLDAVFKGADDALMHAMAPAWISSMTDGSTHAIAVLSRKATPRFDLYNKLFDAWVKQHGLELAKEINETTLTELRKKLADTLSEGAREGESIEDLADRLMEACDGVYSNMSGFRAEMIARTETIRSVNYGTAETYKQEGVGKKEWLASPGGDAADVRPDHQIGSGYGEPYIVGMNESFEVGGEMLEYPGDPSGSAANTIQCRCTIMPVID